MKTINLRDYYPFYTQDTFLEVSDEVAQTLTEAERQEHNYLRRLFLFYGITRWESDIQRFFSFCCR